MSRRRADFAEMVMTSAWITCLDRRTVCERRLICLPHAGAGVASYRTWAQEVDPTTEVWAVRLPGRESRIQERPETDLTALIVELRTAVEPLLDRPFFLFGHSLGAVVAFELARALRAHGQPQPGKLFLSARRAPFLPERESLLHRLPDDQLIAAISHRYGGIPRELLDQPELRALCLPALRADLTLLETYRWAEGEPLACPFVVLAGRQDARTTEPELQAWSALTRGPTSVHWFSGGHFFLHEGARQSVLRLVGDELSADSGGAGSAGSRRASG